MKRVLFALALAGCAGPIDVSRAVTPAEAASANGTSFHAVAIVRSGQRAELPPGVTIEASGEKSEVHVPRPGTFTYALDPGETVVRDKQGRITGVSTPAQGGARITAFVPGTAEQEGNEVHGELEGHVERVPLLPSDRIELRGRFAPGDKIPTGGEVVTSRSISALAFGGALLGGAWLPSVIVAATSSIDANHWLYVPIVGPWVAYATRDACQPSVDPRPCLGDAGERVGLIIDGILQSTGAALLLVGLPASAEVRWGKQASLRIGPRFGGIAIDGSF